MIEHYTDRLGDARWRAIADNGRIVADSSEGYERAIDCRAGASMTLRLLLDSLDEAEAEVDAWLAERGETRSLRWVER